MTITTKQKAAKHKIYTRKKASKNNFHYFLDGGRSSVGRAPGCGPGGRGFKSLRSPHINFNL